MAYHVGTCTHWISLIFYSKYTVTFATTYLKKKPSWLIHHTSLILEFARQATNKMPLQAPSCALWQPWGHIYLNIWNRLSSSAKGCWFEFGDCENRLHLDLDCFCMWVNRNEQPGDLRHGSKNTSSWYGLMFLLLVTPKPAKHPILANFPCAPCAPGNKKWLGKHSNFQQTGRFKGSMHSANTSEILRTCKENIFWNSFSHRCCWKLLVATCTLEHSNWRMTTSNSAVFLAGANLDPQKDQIQHNETHHTMDKPSCESMGGAFNIHL